MLQIIDIVGPATVGSLTAGGIVLANIAAGLGVAGISNSIIHLSLIVITVFNYFVLNLVISFEQSIGIALTVIGCILLALGTKCFGGDDQEEEPSPVQRGASQG